MKKLICLTVFHVIAIHSLSAQRKEFGWLLGSWKLKNKNVYEIWNVSRDGESLEGISLKINGADSVIMEKIKLVSKSGSFYYVPDVNGDQPAVDFKITSLGAGNFFVAENPAHDFPKSIRYQYIRNQDVELLEAVIEGNGKRIPYSFEKVR